MIKYLYEKIPDIPSWFSTLIESKWLDNWILCHEKDGYAIFYKKVTTTRDRVVKEKEKTAEFKEFSEKYPKKVWLSNSKLIAKYNSLVALWKHNEIMRAVEKYTKQIHVDRVTTKFVKNAETWINQECWKDEYNILQNRFSMHDQWIASELQDEWEDVIDAVLAAKPIWEKTHKMKNFSTGVLRWMVEKFKREWTIL